GRRERSMESAQAAVRRLWSACATDDRGCRRRVLRGTGRHQATAAGRKSAVLDGVQQRWGQPRHVVVARRSRLGGRLSVRGRKAGRGDFLLHGAKLAASASRDGRWGARLQRIRLWPTILMAHSIDRLPPRLAPWRLKLGVKLAVGLLPIPYSLWRRTGLFRHGEMLNPEYSRQVVRNHTARA